MARMAKKVSVRKVRNIMSGTETIVEPASEKKPRRQRPVEKEPTTKAEFTVKAGKVQAKLNAIAGNHAKALGTASNRINQKYRDLVSEEVDGLRPEVISLLVFPDFAADAVLEDLVEGKGFVEITVDDKAAE